MVKVTLSSFSATWGKYFGYSNKNDFATGCTVNDNGDPYGTGFSLLNGVGSAFIWSTYADGTTNFLETIETSSGTFMLNSIEFNEDFENKFFVLGFTDVSNYAIYGGSDWVFFSMDKLGRNQCSELGIKNITSTEDNVLTDGLIF